MAAIAIVLSCAVGFLMGLVQFAFMDASLWQASVTYVGASACLSVVAIGASMLIARLAVESGHHEGLTSREASRGTLENWHDWQTEEEMEAEQLRPGVNTVEPEPARSRAAAVRRSV